ncbi:hypothetical protein AVEN_246614-1 [Araneus ventricosus]|uniref:Uncharacterized protein n=1 Tax=Araneus ventricosus TaxID=182803 RepID=A0A4Y2DE13_ARAVE|nr:hypothetical protein AVEN_246614-1 [Araneus ventricosus]
MAPRRHLLRPSHPSRRDCLSIDWPSQLISEVRQEMEYGPSFNTFLSLAPKDFLLASTCAASLIVWVFQFPNFLLLEVPR